MTTLSLQARQDFLEKDAKVSDPIKGIAEFVWNALDADATNVKVELGKNDLGGITTVRIADDGHGISRERADHDFANLGDSIKRKMAKTKTHERAVHGKEGRGRLKFFSIARRARCRKSCRTGGGSMSVRPSSISREAAASSRRPILISMPATRTTSKCPRPRC